MPTAPHSIRIDEDIYNEAQDVLDKMGLSVPAGIKIFLKYVIREQGIPFALTLKSEDKEENQ